MNILITEHKSVGTLAPAELKRTVRVFINFDMDYGYFVPEHLLFQELSPEQQARYLEATDSIEFEVSVPSAQRLIDAGLTPYQKPTLSQSA